MVAIICRTFSNSEYFDSCDLSLTEFTEELLKKILARRKLFLKAKQEDDELQNMYFWDSSTAYLTQGEFHLSKEQNEELFGGGEEYFEFKGNVKETEKLWQRTECDRMVIDEGGVLWTCIPKHTDIYITTPLIPFNKIEEWLGKEKSNG